MHSIWKRLNLVIKLNINICNAHKSGVGKEKKRRWSNWEINCPDARSLTISWINPGEPGNKFVRTIYLLWLFFFFFEFFVHRVQMHGEWIGLMNIWICSNKQWLELLRQFRRPQRFSGVCECYLTGEKFFSNSRSEVCNLALPIPNR